MTRADQRQNKPKVWRTASLIGSVTRLAPAIFVAVLMAALLPAFVARCTESRRDSRALERVRQVFGDHNLRNQDDTASALRFLRSTPAAETQSLERAECATADTTEFSQGNLSFTFCGSFELTQHSSATFLMGEEIRIRVITAPPTKIDDTVYDSSGAIEPYAAYNTLYSTDVDEEIPEVTNRGGSSLVDRLRQKRSLQPRESLTHFARFNRGDIRGFIIGDPNLGHCFVDLFLPSEPVYVRLHFDRMVPPNGLPTVHSIVSNVGVRVNPPVGG